MLCKEEVCHWFSALTAPKRIDLLNGLLRMCLPLELRFIGSCVEGLGRKDWHSLREKEIKANDINEVKTLTHMLDYATRSKLNVYLALLHSSNSVCSNEMYNALTCSEPFHSCALFKQEAYLLYTMAAYHPAFTFSQHQFFFEKLLAIERMLESDKDDPSDFTSSTNGSVSSSPTSTAVARDTVAVPSEDFLYVKNIEMKGSQRTPDRRHEFHLEVTWSDGNVTETYKTYQALRNFHAELIKLFPKDSGAHKQDRQIPFFPLEKGPGHVSHNQKELTDLMRKYINHLIALPDHIVQCAHVTRFLQRTPTDKEAKPPLTVKGVDEETPAPLVHHKGPVVFYNSNIVEARRASSERLRSPGRTQVPTASSITSHSNQRHVYSNVGSSPSPYSSPMQSPLSSPHVSPSTHHSNRPVSPWTSDGRFDLFTWLKQSRLHKYKKEFSEFSLEALFKLDESELESMGLTVGARKKFLSELGKLRQKLKNGVVTSVVDHVSPGATWHSPLHRSVHLSPPVCQLPAGAVSPQKDHSVSTHCQYVARNKEVDPSVPVPEAADNSPDNPKSFSQTGSPEPEQLKSDCPLMDEVDRESERESVATVVKEDKEPFQSVPQGAIVESRPQIPVVFSKQDSNHNNNNFGSVSAGVDMKPPPPVVDGIPLPFPPGIPRLVMPLDPQEQVQMFLLQRPNIRSQNPIEPPVPAATGLQSPQVPGNYENGPALDLGHEATPSSTSAADASVSVLTPEDTLPTYNKHHTGFLAPGPVPSNPLGDGTAVAARPMALPLPVTTSVCNTVMTYSIFPVSSVSTVTSVDIHKGVSVPPQQTILPTSTVDSNAYIAYHSVQNGSGIPQSFQGPGGAPTAPTNAPPPMPSHAAANASTPLQTPVTGVPHLSQTPAPVATPSASPAISQAAHQPTNPPVPCSGTCSCSFSTGSSPGYPPVVWQNHPLFNTGYHAVSLISGSSNGLVPPSLPYSHPLHPMNLPNGLNPDVVYNSQPPNFNVLQQHSENAPSSAFVTSANSGAFSTAPPAHVVPTHIESHNGKAKKRCWNCGEAGHLAADCKELTMDALTHNGYHLNYCAKCDSE